MVLRSVAAGRYVTPLREGGSLPAIIEADDDGLYVLKFRGAGQGPKALIAELVAGESGVHLADFADLRPRITWDRTRDWITPRFGVKRIAILNGGTIPDRGLYGVFLAGNHRKPIRVGELDEEMVFESRTGDTFILGASTWRIEEITHDRVLVAPAPGDPGKMPFWHGDRAGRPLEFGRRIGALGDHPFRVRLQSRLLQHQLQTDPGPFRATQQADEIGSGLAKRFGVSRIARALEKIDV